MVLRKEEAKRLSIISVAEQLGIELKRTGSYSYTWTEHDSFVIDTRKNEFHWNSRTEFGDVIQLVQTIRGVSYKEAMHFLETGEFKAVDIEAQTASKEPFSYHLERYERQDFSASRSYLKAQRGLSDDTINFFISQGSIAEAIRKKGDYFEPVIVFKYKDNTGFLAGASLQGIVENREYYPERGRLKQIMRNSDGQLGFSIDIGNPKRFYLESEIGAWYKGSLTELAVIRFDDIDLEKGFNGHQEAVYHIDEDLLVHDKLKQAQLHFPDLNRFVVAEELEKEQTQDIVAEKEEPEFSL